MNRITKTLWFEVGNNADQHTIDNIVRTASHPLTSSFENLIDLYITVVYISIYNYMLLYNQHREMLDYFYKSLYFCISRYASIKQTLTNMFYPINTDMES